MEIKNKTFIVSGGASGLGLATANLIVQNGGNALVLDINEEAGKLIDNPNILFVKTDIIHEDQVINAINQAKITFGNTIAGIVNCAGIGPAKRVLGKDGLHSIEFFQHVVNVNLVGTFNVIRLGVNEIQQNISSENDISEGVIINTASVAAFDGQIGQAAYSASKAGIVAMTLPLAREFARIGVRVMTIAPGIFETPLLNNLSNDVQASLANQIPFPKRLGKPEEFANLVKQIIENSMLNGEVIRLDGGIRMGMK